MTKRQLLRANSILVFDISGFLAKGSYPHVISVLARYDNIVALANRCLLHEELDEYDKYFITYNDLETELEEILSTFRLGNYREPLNSR